MNVVQNNVTSLYLHQLETYMQKVFVHLHNDWWKALADSFQLSCIGKSQDLR